MKKKSITLLVSCIIFLAIFPYSSLKAIQMMEPQGLSSSEEEINDMDPNLEEVIKETLSIIDRELTTSDLANLTVLKAENKNIQHLSGLEHAVNLTAIDVSNNQITDLLPISNLQSLEEIDVSNNQISSISVIVTLPSLKKLDITNNP